MEENNGVEYSLNLTDEQMAFVGSRIKDLRSHAKENFKEDHEIKAIPMFDFEQLQKRHAAAKQMMDLLNS